MGQQDNHSYEFGRFRLKVAERVLLREGEPVPLTPKVFDISRDARRKRRAGRGQGRLDEASLAQHLCRGRESDSEHLTFAESSRRNSGRSAVYRDCAAARLPVCRRNQRDVGRRSPNW